MIFCSRGRMRPQLPSSRQTCEREKKKKKKKDELSGFVRGARFRIESNWMWLDAAPPAAADKCFVSCD